ncbi:MAG TPA: protein-glutamate O-methyltransferase CheR [Atribacteraceae bacterium]|nr:protein-glutamate O-methyltransferase CheR [Atribacteraceae bacterium]
MLSAVEVQSMRETILRKTGIDLSLYKENQLRRRLSFILMRSGATCVAEYLEKLETDPRVLEDFKNRFTINVSEFFRNPERFDDLEKRVIPELLSGAGSRLNVWSAGCSIGSEAYSIAILLTEMKVTKPFWIWATDIDEEILEKAQEAVFKELHLKNVPDHVLSSSFYPQTDGGFRIKPVLQKNVRFQKHDLLREPVKETFDLVVCRNVVIYFEEEAKKTAFRKLSDSLKKGGYLWIGSTERIPNPGMFHLRYSLPFFYLKYE